MRVVSLLPSATEMLHALGVEPVGVSHSCDYPPTMTDRPAVTSTVIDYENRSSRDIDEQMQSVEGAIYDVNEDLLEELDPDLIVTQATCDVCAVESSDVVAAVARRDLDAEILTLDPHSFEDALGDLRRVGAAVGKETRAERILSRARERVDAVQSSVDALDRPRTAVLDWTDPLVKGGHWVRDVVRLAGGDESFQPDGPSEPVRWRNLREWDPERLIVSPCGFSASRARDAVMELASHEEWERLSAVQSGHVYAVDGNALVNRPGPRLVESLEVLAGCLHPDDVSVTVDDWARQVDLVSKRSL